MVCEYCQQLCLICGHFELLIGHGVSVVLARYFNLLLSSELTKKTSCTYASNYDRHSIKFILPEFVSYLGEREVLCVGNCWHFCTAVFMNMCNITFEVPRLSTFVFKKFSEKKVFTIIFVVNMVKSLKGFGWNNVGPAPETAAQHYFTIGPIVSCYPGSGLPGDKASVH